MKLPNCRDIPAALPFITRGETNSRKLKNKFTILLLRVDITPAVHELQTAFPGDVAENGSSEAGLPGSRSRRGDGRARGGACAVRAAALRDEAGAPRRVLSPGAEGAPLGLQYETKLRFNAALET